jgi:4'-phosphopantetheinyl transferase
VARPSVGSISVECWRVGLEIGAEPVDELLTRLDPDEARRADAFKTADLRRRFVVAHAALRDVLAASLDVAPPEILFGARPCRHCGSPHGKPFVVAPETALEFSLSHSAEVALIAIADGCSVGVDLESVAAPVELVPEARRHRFFVLWTATEALLKATGAGLTGDMRPAGAAASAALSGDGVVELDGRRWAITSVTPRPGYVGAIAVESETASVIWNDWPV